MLVKEEVEPRLSGKEQPARTSRGAGWNWSRRRDLNPWPTVYEIAGESPHCCTVVHGALSTPMLLLIFCMLMHPFAPYCWSKCWSAPSQLFSLQVAPTPSDRLFFIDALTRQRKAI